MISDFMVFMVYISDIYLAFVPTRYILGIYQVYTIYHEIFLCGFQMDEAAAYRQLLTVYPSK